MKTCFSLRFFASVSLGLLSFAWSAAASVEPLPDDPLCTDVDRAFMREAIAMVQWSVERDMRPFSALLVKDGKVIASYLNTSVVTHDITQHAETGLLSAFSPGLDRATLAACTLYASTEPCTMCCGAIRFAGIGRVVYGVTETQMTRIMGFDPGEHPLESKEVFARTAPQVEVLGPLLEAEGLPWHEKHWAQFPLRSR